MGLEEARSRMQLGIHQKMADAILEILKQEKYIKEQNRVFSKYGFKVVVKEDEDAMIKEIIRYFREAAYAPLTTELYICGHQSQKKIPGSVYLSFKQKNSHPPGWAVLSSQRLLRKSKVCVCGNGGDKAGSYPGRVSGLSGMFPEDGRRFA